MKNQSAHEPALDGVRGLAVLAVLVFHALPTTLSGGFLGVDIFFALSGYLITGLLLAEFDATQRLNIRQFFVRRWFRLAPALLAMLLVYGLVVWLFVPLASLKKQGMDILVALLYLTNWARVLSLNAETDLGHTWSLAVEAQFYLLWPFLLWGLLRCFGKRTHLLGVMIALAALSWAVRLALAAQGVDVSRTYNGLDTRAETLMWGAAFAVLASLKSPPQVNENRQSWNLAAALCLGLILWLFAQAQWTSSLYYRYGITLVAVSSALLVFYLHRIDQSWIKRRFEQTWLVWVGSISYGMYLWHFPIYRLLTGLKLDEWPVLAIGMSMTVAISTISFYALERPLMNWRKDKQRARQGMRQRVKSGINS